MDGLSGLRAGARGPGGKRQSVGGWTYQSGEKMGGQRVKRKTRAEGLKKQGEAEKVAGQTKENRMRWQPDHDGTVVLNRE